MIKLLLVPALFLIACGDNKQPNQDQLATNADDDAGSASGAPDNPLLASFIYEPSECADHSVRLLGHFGYADGTPVDNPICRYEFADGSAVDACIAVHGFPVAQTAVFTVTDPVTGETASYQEDILGPLSFNATLEVTSDGLAISWEAHAIYGAGSIVDAQVSITPSANVIVTDPNVFSQPTGTVAVTAAGTYTVRVDAEVVFGEVGACDAFVEKTIDVTCSDVH